MKNMIDRISLWIAEKVISSKCKGVLYGLSGGIDSAVVAALCSKSLRRNQHLGVIMPCGSQKEDQEDAILVASHLNIQTDVFDLGNTYESLSPKSLLKYNNQLANANLKARLRMATLYYFANTLSYMVVGTGNKSEIMVGYGTKYGDEGVDIQPIGDLYKTQVFEMAKVLNLPDKIINKIPSAGLWPGQSDEEEMGITYKELDRILMAIEKNHGWAINDNEASFCIDEKISLEDYRKVRKMVDNSDHKRKMPPIYHIWS
jgi:NAD+ synthase